MPWMHLRAATESEHPLASRSSPYSLSPSLVGREVGGGRELESMTQSLLVALFLKWSCISAIEGSSSAAWCLDFFLALALALAFAFFEEVCVLGKAGTGGGIEEGDKTQM